MPARRRRRHRGRVRDRLVGVRGLLDGRAGTGGHGRLPPPGVARALLGSGLSSEEISGPSLGSGALSFVPRGLRPVGGATTGAGEGMFGIPAGGGTFASGALHGGAVAGGA